MSPEETRKLLAAVESYRLEVQELRRLVVEVQSIALRTKSDVKAELDATFEAIKRHLAEGMGTVQEKLDALVSAADRAEREAAVRKGLLQELRGQEMHDADLAIKRADVRMKMVSVAEIPVESRTKRLVPVFAFLGVVVAAILSLIGAALFSSKR